MATLTRSIWHLLLAASLLWMVGGAFITSDAYEGGSVGSDVATGIQSLASGANIDISAPISSPLAFVLTGLPLALLSLFFILRNRRKNASRSRNDGKPNLRRQTIMVTILALIFALALWNIGDIERGLRQAGVPLADQVDDISVSVIGYPVRLFVTFVHEAGHTLAALLTGGQVQGFEVMPDGSGMASVAGGSVALIAPAGYLGAALLGSLLFFLTNRIPRWTRGLSFVMGLAIVILTLAFALPGDGRSATALIVGIGFGVGLMAMGWFAPRIVNVFALNTLAILTGLNAVFDLWAIITNPAAGSELALNDAARFSQEITPLLSPAVVASLWAAIAVGMLLVAMYFGLIKQVSGELRDAVNGGVDKTKKTSAAEN